MAKCLSLNLSSLIFVGLKFIFYADQNGMDGLLHNNGATHVRHMLSINLNDCEDQIFETHSGGKYVLKLFHFNTMASLSRLLREVK